MTAEDFRPVLRNPKDPRRLLNVTLNDTHCYFFNHKFCFFSLEYDLVGHLSKQNYSVA